MAVVGESSGLTTMIDETYEFSAPRFFDFVNGESEEESCQAELWFETALTYAPSPFMPRIKASRSIKLESLCEFSEDQGGQKTSESSDAVAKPPTEHIGPGSQETELCQAESKEDKDDKRTSLINTVLVSAAKGTFQEDKEESLSSQQNGGVVMDDGPSTLKMEVTDVKCESTSPIQAGTKTCTPKPSTDTQIKEQMLSSKKRQTAKKIASLIKNPSGLKPKGLQSSKAKSNVQANVGSESSARKLARAHNLAQENQAIKRQKLEGGKSRQILNPKPQVLVHKSKGGVVSGNSHSSYSSVTRNADKEGRKMYVREPAAPFVSMAEMMKKFQSSTRELSLSHTNKSLSHDGDASLVQRPKLTLTRPKEPEFETSQRVRSVKIKSTVELEEEMMAKIPKFKARPLNKKILEAPTLPALPRSKPQLPEFQEFHFETMTRANQNAEYASVASTETSQQKNEWIPRLTAPKSPKLHTSLRVRPPRVKSSLELEQEELEKAPKFKARPLNKKIFESKGELGIFCNLKKEVTKPQEFHFATNERIPPPAAVVDLFDKLSINSETRSEKPLPRITTPNPFHLRTEERGAEKERKHFMEVTQKQWEEECARVPKAKPYPYTTDFPVIPRKPEPKQPTRPEPFQLESLVRHEMEKMKEMEERQKKEKEEAEMRKFKAQPILKEDPIPVPEKVRKPLTQVQEFNHRVNNRAVERAEFDQKVKEKEMMYKRYREESEAARMVEEEKALKMMRRTLVPHARPLPKFDNPFQPQKSSKETTKAKSPKLCVQQRKERRRMFSASGAGATHLR